MEEFELEFKTNDELFRIYKKTKNHRVKEELTLRYAYIAKIIAFQMREFYRNQLELEDIVQEGIIAIMEGIDRYDPDQNVVFSTFINTRIRGMIIDMMRKNSWLPRTFFKDKKKIQNAIEELEDIGIETISDRDIIKRTGLSEKRYNEVERLSGMLNVLSIDQTYTDSEKESINIKTYNENVYPEEVILKKERQKLIENEIKTLPEREQMILSLYYVDELRTVDIAEILEISQPRVSQLHRRALDKLRKKIVDKRKGGEKDVPRYV